jgi:hypothetical protein
MEDETYNSFCLEVPDLSARYHRITQIYFTEKKLALSPKYQTPWRKIVLNEIPNGFTVSDWLSLVTNYKIRKKKEQKPKTVEKLETPKKTVSTNLPRENPQLKIF